MPTSLTPTQATSSPWTRLRRAVGALGRTRADDGASDLSLPDPVPVVDQNQPDVFHVRYTPGVGSGIEIWDADGLLPDADARRDHPHVFDLTTATNLWFGPEPDIFTPELPDDVTDDYQDNDPTTGTTDDDPARHVRGTPHTLRTPDRDYAILPSHAEADLADAEVDGWIDEHAAAGIWPTWSDLPTQDHRYDTPIPFTAPAWLNVSQAEEYADYDADIPFHVVDDYTHHMTGDPTARSATASRTTADTASGLDD